MRLLFSSFLLLSFASPAYAGTITGQIQTPSTGRGVPNGTLTFTLSQAAVVSGTATLAGNANCWTDSSGNVVGLPGDAAIAAPVLSSNLGSGTLPGGTYFVRYTWANGTGESQPSAERSLVLGSSGTLIVQAPLNVPPLAASMKVYIGTTSGGESLQGNVTVTNGVIAGNYNQAASLVNGAALPSSNTSACQIRFNDELQPSFTAYSVTLNNLNGAGIAGFPQKWYLQGGSNGIVNVSLGTPLYSGTVVYPQAVLQGQFASVNGMGVIAPGNFLTSGWGAEQSFISSSIGGINIGAASQVTRGTYNMDVIAGGVTVPNIPASNYAPSGKQINAIGGYVINSAQAGPPYADPVALYGETRLTGQGEQGWGLNAVCEDTSGINMTGSSCYGFELDVNSSGSPPMGGAAMDLNGNISGGGNFIGIEYIKPGAGRWSPGLYFVTGSTPSPDSSGNGAIRFDPLNSGINQASQGPIFVSNDPVSGQHMFSFQESSGGDLSFGVPNVATRFVIGVGGTLQENRPRCNLGSAVTVADISISAGWGTGATVSSVKGTDCAVQISITAGTSPNANPFFNFTYHDGAWPSAPIAQVSRCDGSAPQTAQWVTSAPSTTVVGESFIGTPVNGNVYCAVVTTIGAP